MPLKLDLFFGLPSYGGNGGISSEVPQVRQWFTRTMLAAKKDDRVGQIHELTIGDTPVTMVRNKFVVEARRRKADVLLMVDSDMNPLLHEDEPDFKDFFTSSFDAIFNHYAKGPLVIGAPYCGSPGAGENSFVFYWEYLGMSEDGTPNFKLCQYPRSMATQQRGIQEAAALPTGMIMYDMRAFELIEPRAESVTEILEMLESGKITVAEARQSLSGGWFYYEWSDGTASEKASTEDVTNTRDISLAGIRKLGYNPIRCNWDSPVGHWKPWCTPGRPTKVDASNACSVLSRVFADPDEIVHFTNTELLMQGEVHMLADPSDTNLGHETPDSDIDDLGTLLKDIPHKVVYELGTWTGKTAAEVAKWGHSVFCVDHFEGCAADETKGKAKFHGKDKIRKQWRENTKDLSCVLIERDVVEVACDVESGKLARPDIVIIDAGHTYGEVYDQLEAWWPLIFEGGGMIGHDWECKQLPGVTKAVLDFFSDHDVRSVGNWWYVTKVKDAVHATT